ncbi:hypothetical protein GH714_022553 [Hevea brasiliensis]|uniref:GTD-binding domain-containing protein n=1 Tax=Hevea brasiliensis TaxID=3981 RepID=A0A6A6KK96_HEVBR|nr:hypothetical protein GH714_022553 [Hevea brasiliensis]
MPCHAIRGWNFSELVGAFLDLSITFLLLCASTLAYFASKFLGLFGLNLPCPCNSFFASSDNTNNTCLQRRLVDYPSQKISSVQSSVKSKFPFGSIGNDLQWNSNKENDKHEGVGSEGEVSCISSSERRTDNNTCGDLAKMKEKSFVMGAMNLPDVKEGRHELKGKWVSRHRSRHGLRRRRKGSVDHNGKFSWVPSYKSLWSNVETPQSASARISKLEDEADKDPANFEGASACNVNACEILNAKEASVDIGSKDIGSKRKFSHGFELNESVDENEPTAESALTADEINSNADQGSDCNAKSTIRLLEQALEEEHAARAVLYIELEKERSAAATAADEAMAMILRLQEEKASIEMEAIQCQRIIEEKYAYDAEEMNILKEILVRREREKYYLEKEVEAYRQIIYGNEQLDAEMYGVAETKGEIILYSSNEDMPPQPSNDSTDKEEKEFPSKKFSEDNSNRVDIPRHPSPEKNPDEERKAQKIIATSKLIQSTIPPAHNLHQKAIDHKENEGAIHDVHVIDDQASVYKRVMRDKNKQLSMNASANSKNPNIPIGLPPTGSSRSRSLRSDMRRKSMSAFDAERFKIDNEISWLREKLKFVQEGREKLQFTKGNAEREKIQLQIVEDIISQLREIRQLTEPGKAARRASLPPLTSNVMSKKRRWRSGPLLVEGSIFSQSDGKLVSLISQLGWVTEELFSGKMPCHEIQSWTLSRLVGAFLDLSIAYLLLCASTLAYSASKFLGMFGLSLPCPCNGLFGDPNSDNCWQTALVDCQSEKISSVQFSVKSKFPFDSIWDKNLYQTNCENTIFGLDDEASSGSFHERSEEVFVGSSVMYARDVKERFDKEKGCLSQKVRLALGRRRKGSTEIGRSSSSSSYDPFRWDAQALRQSPASASKMMNASDEGSMVPDSSGGNILNYGRDSSVELRLLGRKSPDFESNEPINEIKPTEKVTSPEDELKFNAQGELPFGPDENNAIRVLEQALAAEHAARAALYLELEKERSSAATAAEEAMAMILRLQEEKASIEMEARQHQRMIEAKSAYDFEEMNILKEILLRREREKYVLEKEVETYRQVIFGSKQLHCVHYDPQGTGTSHGKGAYSLQYSGEDPLQMLQRIGESICEKENVDHTLVFGKELPIPKLDEVFPQERDIQLQFDLSTAEGYNLHEKTVAPLGEVQKQSDVIITSEGLASKAIQTCNETENSFPYNSDDSEKHDQDSCNAMVNMDAHVHDVYMIGDKFNMPGEFRGIGIEKLLVNANLDIPKSCDSRAITSSQTKHQQKLLRHN